MAQIEVFNFFENSNLWQREDLFASFSEEMRQVSPDLSAKDAVVELLSLVDAGEEIDIEEIGRAIELFQSDFLGVSAKVLVCPMNPEDDFYRNELNGVYGYSSSEAVVVAIDTSVDWKGHAFRTVLHELSHLVRYKHSDPAESLLDWLVFEGLAEHYVSEKTREKSKWLQELPFEESLGYADRISPFWSEKRPYHELSPYFWGSREDGIRRSMGYFFGYELVSKHRFDRSELPWSEYIKVQSQDFAKSYYKITTCNNYS